jgi:hypothetical protein
MAFDDRRTRLDPLGSGRAGAADGGTVGKQSLVDATYGPIGGRAAPTPASPVHDGGFAELGPEREGGEGSPAATPGGAGGGKGAAGGKSAGKITVATKPAPGNSSTARTTVGVGEKLTFSSEEEGTWRLDQKDLGQGQSIEWSAPDTGTMGNLVFEPYLTSPNKNARSSLPIFVLAPSKVDFKKTGDVPVSSPGLAGVGMTTEVTVGPNSVSFGAAEWFEQPGPAENVTGYFAEYVKTGQSLAHKPNPSWLPMGDNNNEVRDHAWTKDKPKLTHPTDQTQRWWAGSFQWTIPNHYRLKGGASHLITYVTQSFTMDDAGAITVTKGAASATSKPDNEMAGDIQKFATEKDAMGFLQLHGRGGCIQAVMNYKRNPKADPASVQNLIKALRSVNVELYTYVTCKNTFAWTDPDKVTLTANGKPSKEGTRKINTGEGHEFLFDVNSILDLDKMSPNDSINFAAAVDDVISSHPHSATLAFPYSMKDAVMVGSDRYTISAYLR